MVIAITGASGHIGVNLCRILEREGHSLKLLINKSTKGIDHLKASFVYGDLDSKRALKTLVKHAEVVIHLAAKISIDLSEAESVYRTNITGTQNLIEACKVIGIKHFIFFSSIHALDPFPLNEPLNESRAYVKKPTAYDQSKIEGEKLVLKASDYFKVNIVYPTSVVGVNDYYPSLLGQAILDMYTNKIPALTKGGYNFVDVEDVANGTLLIIKKGLHKEKYIFSGEYLTIRSLYSAIQNNAQTNYRKVTLSFWILHATIPILKWYAILNGKKPLFTKEALNALKFGNPLITHKKATIELGYKPTAIEITIQKTINWFKVNGYLY